MPISNAQGAFNVGRDCQLVIQHPLAANGRLDIPNVTGFQCAQQVANVKVDRLDGVQLSAQLPKGWTGSFNIDRGSSGVDDLFALIEANWYGSAGQMLPATIFQYVIEVNGSTSTFQYTSVSMHLGDAGGWHGDQVVKQTINFEAFKRLRS